MPLGRNKKAWVGSAYIGLPVGLSRISKFRVSLGLSKGVQGDLVIINVGKKTSKSPEGVSADEVIQVLTVFLEISMHRKIQNIFLISSVVAFIGFTGCAGTYHSFDDNGFNLAELESIVKVNETSADDLRKLFRKPTLTGVTLNGETVIAYSFRSETIAPAALASMATLGFVTPSAPFTIKIAYFKLDSNGKVVEIKKKGYAYLLHNRYNKCESDLTDAEVNSPANFTSYDEVCQRYRNGVAQRRGIDPKSVDDDEEFFRCNEKCQAIRGAKELFGQFRWFKGDFDWKHGDGDRILETGIIHNPAKKVVAEEN